MLKRTKREKIYIRCDPAKGGPSCPALKFALSGASFIENKEPKSTC